MMMLLLLLLLRLRIRGGHRARGKHFPSSVCVCVHPWLWPEDGGLASKRCRGAAVLIYSE